MAAFQCSRLFGQGFSPDPCRFGLGSSLCKIYPADSRETTTSRNNRHSINLPKMYLHVTMQGKLYKVKPHQLYLPHWNLCSVGNYVEVYQQTKFRVRVRVTFNVAWLVLDLEGYRYPLQWGVLELHELMCSWFCVTAYTKYPSIRRGGGRKNWSAEPTHNPLCPLLWSCEQYWSDSQSMEGILVQYSCTCDCICCCFISI